jgi:cell division protein FtsW (lipid II flippase)
MVSSASRLTPPGTIVAAFFGFLVSTVGALAAAGFVLSSRQEIVDAVRHANARMTDDEVQKAATLGQAIAVGVAAVIALFYLWLAFRLKAGRNWARVVLTIVTLLQVASLFVTRGDSVVGYAGCAVAVLATVLSYLPPSESYIRRKA